MSQGSLFRRVFVWTALLLGLVTLLGTQPAAAKATVILVTSTGHEVAPFVNDGDQVLDLFVFVNVNGVFQVDSVVFDPFDLSPGYGFEKS